MILKIIKLIRKNQQKIKQKNQQNLNLTTQNTPIKSITPVKS